jgi:hypothetical protein
MNDARVNEVGQKRLSSVGVPEWSHGTPSQKKKNKTKKKNKEAH